MACFSNLPSPYKRIEKSDEEGKRPKKTHKRGKNSIVNLPHSPAMSEGIAFPPGSPRDFAPGQKG
jgi:hypothetical protein